MLDNSTARKSVAKIIDPFAKKLVSAGVSPDTVTVLGALLSSLVAFAFIPSGHFLLAALLFGFCSLSDLLDGTMARMTNTASKWGAFLDSTLDRIVDASLLIALMLYFQRSEPKQNLVLIALVVALVSSQTISYVRAKAESLGAQASVGIAERAERSLITWLGLVMAGLGLNVLPFAIYALAAVSVITVVQRFLYIRKQLIVQS